jgi:hypothetical protein
MQTFSGSPTFHAPYSFHVGALAVLFHFHDAVMNTSAFATVATIGRALRRLLDIFAFARSVWNVGPRSLKSLAATRLSFFFGVILHLRRDVVVVWMVAHAVLFDVFATFLVNLFHSTCV